MVFDRGGNRYAGRVAAVAAAAREEGLSALSEEKKEVPVAEATANYRGLQQATDAAVTTEAPVNHC